MAYKYNPISGQFDLVDLAGAAAQQQITDLVDLSGMPANSTDLNTFTGTTIPDDSTVKGALQALETGLEDHKADATDAHDASAISNAPAGTIAATDVQSAINELDGDVVAAQADATQALTNAGTAQTDINNHIADTVDAHDASAISSIPSGNLAATEVQAALNELQTNIDDVQTDVNDLVTLSGVAANATTLGTFTGAIIPDSSTVKAALQSLETFVQAIPSPFYYAGVWAASTNTPTLANTDVGEDGAVYYVTDSGTVNFGAGAIVFNAGDKVANNGTTWDKWDMTDAVASVNGQVGVVVLTTTDIAEGTATYFTDERAQDAVGTILTDSNTIDFTYTDATPSIVADIRTQLSITSDASGIKLVNDASTPGNNYYYGTNGAGVKGYQLIVAPGSTGDLPETLFSAANNQVAPANVTGFLFPTASVRSFRALVSVTIDATADLFEEFTLNGINKGSSWNMSTESVGDISGVTFSIDASGQIQYTSSNESGFVSDTIKFRAQTTTV